MANTRIKDIQTVASALNNDDYVVLDGNTQGTRKIGKADLISDITGGINLSAYAEKSNNLSDLSDIDAAKATLGVPEVGLGSDQVPLNGFLNIPTIGTSGTAVPTNDAVDAKITTATAGIPSVGPGNQQVPTNGMLGALAYQSSLAETGTFTPEIRSSVGGSVLGASSASAVYTKIGNLVYIHVSFTNINSSTSTSAFYVTGLPYDCAAANAGDLMVTTNYMDITTTFYTSYKVLQVYAKAKPGQAAVQLYFTREGGNEVPVQWRMLGTNAAADLTVSGIYRVD